MKIDDLVVFTAPEFQATLTLGLFVDYSQRVLIEGFSLYESLQAILTATAQSNFARHTNMMIIHRDEGLSIFSITHYFFTHAVLRP